MNEDTFLDSRGDLVYPLHKQRDLLNDAHVGSAKKSYGGTTMEAPWLQSDSVEAPWPDTINVLPEGPAPSPQFRIVHPPGVKTSNYYEVLVNDDVVMLEDNAEPTGDQK